MIFSIAVCISFFLKANPKDVGLPALEDQVAPEGSDRQDEPKTKQKTSHFLDDKNPAEALWAFAKSGRFWLICSSIMCTTILMDFFVFLPLSLTSFEGVSSAKAGTWASAFPIGCLLALAGAGFLYDRVSRKGRIALLGGLLGATCVCIAALWSLKALPIIPDSFKFPLVIVVLFFYGFTLATVAGKLGLEVILLLDKGTASEPQGPRLLSSLYGAKVEIFEAGFDQEFMVKQSLKNKRIEELVAEVRSKGRNPYVLDLDIPLAKMGYVNEIGEICDQLQEQGTTVQYLVVANASGCTMGGLLVAAKYFKAPFEVIGVSVLDRSEVAQGRTANRANEIARLLETDLTFNPEELTIYYDYIGEGYGIPTKECIEAIKLVARTEGILLDPVYTGKAMAGLIDLIGKGKFSSEDTVIFLHTGGVATLFVYNKELSC